MVSKAAVFSLSAHCKFLSFRVFIAHFGNYPEPRNLHSVMKPLSIVVFLDGRPGHEKQTSGIVQAISAITPVEQVDTKVVQPSALNIINSWIKYLFSSILPFATDRNEQSVDLVIGTGTHTHLPMLLYKKGCHGQPRSITCMTPDALLLNKFDLCCVPRHDVPSVRKNIFTTLGPPNNVAFSNNHAPDRGLILVGGADQKSHAWNSLDIVENIKNILVKDSVMTWTLSSSPRTPDETCRLLDEMAAGIEKVSFIRSTDTPAGWVEEQYALNSKVWVTADSMSMIYEPLTAGCSVGVLPVQWKQQDNKFQLSIDVLVEKQLVIEYEQWLAGANLPPLQRQPLNEAHRCAEEILRRWWPDRLP